MPSRPSASITIGSAVPSLRPPSAVSDTRTASRSFFERICTSEASTGSVGARMAASSSAPIHPSDGISHTPTSVPNAMVATMPLLARIAATRQPLSVNGVRSRRPTANSEISTAVSVMMTSMSARSGAVGASFTFACAISPAIQPTARYALAGDIGRRVTWRSNRHIASSTTPSSSSVAVSIALRLAETPIDGSVRPATRRSRRARVHRATREAARAGLPAPADDAAGAIAPGRSACAEARDGGRCRRRVSGWRRSINASSAASGLIRPSATAAPPRSISGFASRWTCGAEKVPSTSTGVRGASGEKWCGASGEKLCGCALSFRVQRLVRERQLAADDQRRLVRVDHHHVGRHLAVGQRQLGDRALHRHLVVALDVEAQRVGDVDARGLDQQVRHHAVLHPQPRGAVQRRRAARRSTCRCRSASRRRRARR